jgi:hypothetical protein
MTLMTPPAKAKHRPTIKGSEYISPSSVLSMLQHLRTLLWKLDVSFTDIDLEKVLAVVEEGECDVSTGRDEMEEIRLDLSHTRRIISFYRVWSEGGCRSCIHRGRNRTLGHYCQISDPEYNCADSNPGTRGRTLKVEAHYENPCSEWEPKFSPKIEELVEEE